MTCLDIYFLSLNHKDNIEQEFYEHDRITDNITEQALLFIGIVVHKHCCL